MSVCAYVCAHAYQAGSQSCFDVQALAPALTLARKYDLSYRIRCHA